jgi:orotate phosphoribosyltransferase
MHSRYLNPAFEEWEKVVDEIVAAIKESGVTFDAIAVRGISGMFVGPVVANKLHKRLMVVRKEKDESHGWYKVECSTDLAREGVRYIFVDDLISTGKTPERVREAVNEQWTVLKRLPCPTLIACFCYAPERHKSIIENKAIAGAEVYWCREGI